MVHLDSTNTYYACVNDLCMLMGTGRCSLPVAEVDGLIDPLNKELAADKCTIGITTWDGAAYCVWIRSDSPKEWFLTYRKLIEQNLITFNYSENYREWRMLFRWKR